MSTNKKVIVVDDSRVTRQLILRMLVDAGYDVVEAVDGLDGLDKVAKNPDATLVICDVNMPNMDGLQMLSTVKGKAASDGPPFLMVTTEAQLELVQQAKTGGAKGWIVKPFKPEILLAAVRKLAV
jgi:two-component system, chemotaxis family, chemotaxis protein CheY